jgi:hypothetical protein
MANRGCDSAIVAERNVELPRPGVGPVVIAIAAGA